MKLTEKDITAETAKRMREGLGMSQAAFWGPLGVKQSVGCKYEQSTKIPRSVRILLVARYVSGLAIDTQTQEGVEELTRLGSVQVNRRVVRQELDKAAQHIEHAKATLGKV